MMKVINNKRYNTKTAEYFGRYEHDTDDTDARYIEELYRKRTGEFFLYTKGGKDSIYKVEVSFNKYKEGEKIIPLSTERAEDWIRAHKSADFQKKYFDKDDEKMVTTITISKGAYNRLCDIAVSHGISKGAVIEGLIDGYKS